jgi:hypothetical protein
MKNFEKNMKHQVRFGRIKKTVFWIFSIFFLLIFIKTLGESYKLISEYSSVSEPEEDSLSFEGFVPIPISIPQTVSSTPQADPSIEIINFNSGLTYFPGGSVSVLFDPKGFFPLDNVFKLELSDASGSFASPTVLASEAEFFTPILNGRIPSGTPLGTGYKLRITYGLEAGPRTPFELPGLFKIGAISTSYNIPFFSISPSAVGIEFVCLDNPNIINTSPNFQFGSFKQGNSALLPSELEINESSDSWKSTSIKMYSLNSTGTWVSSNLLVIDDFGFFTKIPKDTPVGYYLIEFTKTISSRSLTYTYLFNYNTGNSGISNLSSESVCVGSSVDFEISLSGIAKNYPGSRYTINWGDGSNEETFTHNQLVNNQFVSHQFDQVTCNSSNVEVLGGKTFFKIDFNLFNKGLDNVCGDYLKNGNGTSKFVNTSLAPIADFETQKFICEESVLIAIDTSTPGAYGDMNSCLTDYQKNWFVTQPNGTERRVNLDTNPDGTLVNPIFDGWLDVNGNLQIPSRFVKPGCWTIRLEVYNPPNTGCPTRTSHTEIVNVQAKAEPSFTIDPESGIICKDDKIQFTNESNVVELECQNPTFEWIVTPVAAPATSSGFSFTDGTTSTSTDPTILFSEPGSYNVVLKITNVCGEFESDPQKIDVLGAPTVVFSAADDFEICQIAPAGFELDFSETAIKPEFGEFPFTPETFKWEVFEEDQTTPADPTSFEFVAPTTSTDPLPIINFKKYGIYQIKITVTTKCDESASDFFRFELKQEPEITNTDLTQTICSGEETVEIEFESTMLGSIFSWTVAPVDGLNGYVETGLGDKLDPMTIINSTNSPLQLVYEVIATNDGCNSEIVEFTFTVNPTPVIDDKEAIICSGDSFTVTPVNVIGGDIVPESTGYEWEVTSIVGTVTGVDLNDTGIGNVTGTINNVSSTAATIVYTVTPTSPNNCEGDEFTVTVTVNPEPVVADQTITACSDAPLGVNFNSSSSVAAATYNITALNLNGLIVSAGGAKVEDGVLA